MRPYHRNRKGGAIAETGPALLLLLIFVLFPVFDLMQIGCGYAFAWFLHNQEVREATVRQNAQQGCDAGTTDVFTHAKTFMSFCGIQPTAVTATATVAPANPPTQPVDTVTIDTQCSVRPFLMIPFFPNTPGLSAPIPLHFTTTANREEAGKD